MTEVAPRVALVTGAGRRIGAAIAMDLARHDFAVAVHVHRSLMDAERLVSEIKNNGGKATIVEGDLLSEEDCRRIMAEAESAFGPVGLLVNNASIFEDDSVLEFDTARFDRHFAVHVKAPSILTSEMVERLPTHARGLVVNIIDQRVWALNPRFYSYTLSKAALWTATQTLAQALAPRIRVNALGPGPTFKSIRQTDADFQAQIDGLLLKSGPALEEFGRSIRFLFDTPSITGQMIAIDGGQHLAWQTPDVTEIPE
ncbi:SDR family oxidoreductase [Rhizobium alvei]|uniref:SDR family oxidoreductase n=1 Tax=Rhizobium alvei TaxID=1132659 RepID=A0ABT8YJE3_9HYPH|nr:SDR family oxidoreductase [Rhizobium alvei]MDO6963719.1 SDR family oxidoreductase [Rhizobium alvei]